jgi:hypothetical protein
MQCHPRKTPHWLLRRTDGLTLKFIWKFKGPGMAKTSLREENKAEDSPFLIVCSSTGADTCVYNRNKKPEAIFLQRGKIDFDPHF